MDQRDRKANQEETNKENKAQMRAAEENEVQEQTLQQTQEVFSHKSSKSISSPS